MRNIFKKNQNLITKNFIPMCLCNVNHVRDRDTHTHIPGRMVSRSAYFESDGPMMEIKMWRPWRQCISPKCLKSHLCPNGPSTECSRSVATVTYAYRVVGILGDDKQRRSRCHRKSNCKSFSLEQSRLELRSVL